MIQFNEMQPTLDGTAYIYFIDLQIILDFEVTLFSQVLSCNIRYYIKCVHMYSMSNIFYDFACEMGDKARKLQLHAT